MEEEVEKKFGDALAEMRTLFALERNYLAEKRTYLANLRTGIALALFIPPIVIFSTSLDIDLPFLAVVLFLCFITSVTAGGLWIIFTAYMEIREVKKKITLIKYREKERINSSLEVRDLFQDVFFIDKHNLDSEFKAFKNMTKNQEEKEKQQQIKEIEQQEQNKEEKAAKVK